MDETEVYEGELIRDEALPDEDTTIEVEMDGHDLSEDGRGE